jgi:hypothetical protein
MIELIHVESEKHLADVRKLFLEYAVSLGFSLCFQDFDKELAGLPGLPPDGRLIRRMKARWLCGFRKLERVSAK